MINIQWTKFEQKSVVRGITRGITLIQACTPNYVCTHNYMIVHLQPLGESQPLKVFHRGLLEMLITLLQNHSEDCLKCIGNMLKVC